MNNKSRIRIEFLDGIRGASAVFVVVFHAMLFTQYGVQYSNNFIINSIQKFVSIGHISVSIFIVLSGFCLTIPVIKNGLKLKDGLLIYIKRRANRIIFPYYGALIFSVLLYLIFPVLSHPSNTAWDSKIPLTLDSIMAHLFLVHNLSENWIFKINGAHWSVATEWQIYFLFPIMLYLWRKFSLAISIAFSTLITMGFYYLVPFAEPQFILLFLLGGISAYYSFSKNQFLNRRWHFIACLILFIPISIAVYFKFPAKVLTQLVFGLNFAVLLKILVTNIINDQSNFISRFFELSIFRFLGKISYSLYLIHGPLLALFNILMINKFSFSYDVQLLIMWFLVVPFCVFIYYLYYLAIERRFLYK